MKKNIRGSLRLNKSRIANMNAIRGEGLNKKDFINSIFCSVFDCLGPTSATGIPPTVESCTVPTNTCNP